MGDFDDASPDIPLTVVEASSPEMFVEETLNTPQPILEPFNCFPDIFPSMKPEIRSSFIFTRREDVVSDCTAKQDTARLQTVKPDLHHHQLEEQERRPTMRVEPLKREVGPTEDLKEDEEEKEEEGNPLLSYFPCIVLGLILVMIVASCQQELISLVVALIYQYYLHLTDLVPWCSLSTSSQETSQ